MISIERQLVQWIAMAGLSVKKSKRNEVLQRTKAGQCLMCDKVAKQRGLCHAHYFQFYRGKMSLPESERIDYERKHIQAGKILASGQSRQIKSPNPYLSDEEE